ncbi:MAG: O-antigen ligase family protein [Candidatus Parcubacteria bacterium]|nr:O-antigen ligase family protein [Candidatus Parcubacteria bacterium]
MSGIKKILIGLLLLSGFISMGFSQADLPLYYILVFIALILAVTLLVRYPQVGIYLIALLFPFTYLEFVYGDLNVPYVDLVALMLFIAWMIRQSFMEKREPLTLKMFPGLFFMALYVIACFLSLLNVEHEYFSFCLKYLLRPIIFFYLMFVVLPFNLVDTLKKLKNVLQILFVLGVTLAFTGVWSLLFPPVVGARRVLPISILGVYPLGQNHNLLSEVFIFLIPMALILFWQEKNIFWKNIYLSGAILMAGINLLTLSRSGWIALGVQLAILVWLKYRQQMKKILSPAALYLLAIVLIPAIFLMYKLTQAGITESATLNRLKLIEVSFMLFRKYPLFGSGVGIFTQIMSQVKWYIIEYGSALDSHGFIFKNLAETGFVGTACFCFLIFYFIYIIYKAYQQNAKAEYSWVILGFFLAVIGVFIFQLFGTSYYIVKTWLPVGLALATLKLYKVRYLS